LPANGEVLLAAAFSVYGELFWVKFEYFGIGRRSLCIHKADKPDLLRLDEGENKCLVEIREHLGLTGQLPIIALFVANVPGKTPRFARISWCNQLQVSLL
jgi:hypothetical protein